MGTVLERQGNLYESKIGRAFKEAKEQLNQNDIAWKKRVEKEVQNSLKSTTFKAQVEWSYDYDYHHRRNYDHLKIELDFSGMALGLVMDSGVSQFIKKIYHKGEHHAKVSFTICRVDFPDEYPYDEKLKNIQRVREILIAKLEDWKLDALENKGKKEDIAPFVIPKTIFLEGL